MILGGAVRSLSFTVALAAAAQTTGVYTVAVSPKKGETLAGPCRFELTLPARDVSTRAVLAVIDRGRETRSFYDDPAVFEFAGKHRLGLLWARHCPSEETGDLDPVPANGIGRALLAGLDELAQETKHAELSSAKLILFGFGDAGALAAAMPAFATDRVLASIAYAPVRLGRVQLTPAQAGIPQFIVANGADPIAGTREPYDYFDRHFANGAPWVFAMQNGAPHEGALESAKELILSWMDLIVTTTPDTTAPVSMPAVQRTGWWLYIQTQDTALRDSGGRPVARAKDAKFEKVGQTAPASFSAAGWVSSKKTASEWQTFVRRQSHVSDAKY